MPTCESRTSPLLHPNVSITRYLLLAKHFFAVTEIAGQVPRGAGNECPSTKYPASQT